MTHADRRLAAILSADVAGYSRLMGEDEPGTIAALAECFALFRRHLEEYNGRLVDTAGDSLLAVFESVTDAVLCAMAAQKSLAEWNDPRPTARRMVLRVGVNLGDIFLQADGHVYGDGVNVAARLQTFAEPGGICVSEMVRAAVGNRLPAVFDSLGEQKFKNIAVPMSVYGARLIPDAALPDPPTPSAWRDAGEPTTIVFASPLSQRLMDQVRAVAATAATVLIQGESGVGKELLARRIHEESPRRGRPSSRWTALRSLGPCSRASYSGMSAVPCPGPCAIGPGTSSRPRGARCFSTRWETSHPSCNSSSSGRCKTRRSSAWGTGGPDGPT